MHPKYKIKVKNVDYKVKVLEPLVLLDLSRIREPLLWTKHQKLLDKIFSLVILQEFRELQFLLRDDILEYLKRVLGSMTERLSATEKLVETNAKRPVISGVIIACREKDLGSSISWGADQGISTILDLFAGAKVKDLDEAFIIYENVLWLKVSVDNVL